MAKRTAALLAYVGGALLLYAGVSGNAGLWDAVGAFVGPMIEDPAQRALVEVVIQIFIVLAGLGGIAVIIGGYLVSHDRVLLGKVLIFLGAATGLIGILIGVGVTMAEGGGFTDYFTDRLNGTAGTVGVIMAWFARRWA